MAKKVIPPRKYLVIWNKIKNNEVCKIECHPNSVRTIKTGVIKEKHRDEGFKILNEVERFFLDISIEDIPGKNVMEITFRLKSKFGLASVNHGCEEKNTNK